MTGNILLGHQVISFFIHSDKTKRVKTFKKAQSSSVKVGSKGGSRGARRIGEPTLSIINDNL